MSRSLSQASGAMAVGTLVSRGTGFLRTVAIFAALGDSRVNDAYTVGNTTPNIFYDLLLGGVLSSVVVPLLVRAQRDDEDGGHAFASSLLTLVVVALTLAAAAGVAAAPLLMHLYLASGTPAPERALAVTFTRYFLPQMVFYGVTATVTALLNTRGRFAAPSFAPVLNNLVVIATAAALYLEPGPRVVTDRLTTVQTATLGVGTTLGVVVMALWLLPAARRAGIRLRPRLDLSDPRLREAARLGGWVFGYAAVNQVGYLFVTRFASRVTGGYAGYSSAYQVFQLPYAVIAVSVTSALLPRMSRHAADGRADLVRRDVSRGLRLAGVLLVPAALGLVALGVPVATAAFAHGQTGPAGGAAIGAALAAMSLGLPAFAAFQLLLRVMYAYADSRTPTLVNVVVNVVNVGIDAAVVATWPRRDLVTGLALGLTASYLAGTAVAAALLRRRLGGLDGARVTRLLVRAAVAGGLAATVAWGVDAGVQAALGHGSGPALLGSLAGGLAGGAVYLRAARRTRIRELEEVVALLPRPLRRTLVALGGPPAGDSGAGRVR